MTQLHPSWLLCGMLAIGSAQAAPAPSPAPDAQHGACALALQAKQAQQQQAQAGGAAPPAAPPSAPPPAAGRKKVNPDSLLDPCQLADADQDRDLANNDGKSAQEIDEQLSVWVEWNRRYSDSNDDALRRWLDDDDAAYGDGQRWHGSDGWGGHLAGSRFDGAREPMAPAGIAPAVAEPPAGLMLSGGLVVLWLLAAWRRRVRRQR